VEHDAVIGVADYRLQGEDLWCSTTP
jgi:hypothetical protein